MTLTSRMVSISQAMLLFVLALLPLGTTYAAVPSGFVQTGALVTVNQPTAMAFNFDGSQLFITERAGRLRLVDISSDAVLTLRTNPVIDLSARICTESERGLLGIAIDPQFATNRAFYLFYTYKKSATCANNSPQSPVNRVSQFILSPSGAADPGSERVLVDNMPSPNGNHNAGALHFGNDGYLYIAIGDGGCDYAGGGCGGTNDAARDLFVLTGKLLRIIANPDLPAAQRIPPTNPYASTGAICAVDGRTVAGTPCKEIIATGLRNPFRMAFDPNTTGTLTVFYVNDVGQDAWEEVNRGELGADYRWNTCEGLYLTNTQQLCPTPQGAQRNPIHAYAHNGTGTAGCTSITGGAIVPQGVWPDAYAGTYLFADYVCGKLFQIDPGAPANRTTFASNLGAVVDLAFGPGPSGGKALYYARIDTGSIRRISPVSTTNGTPSAALTVSPQYGSLQVTFDGSESSDPNGDTLTYLWDFGDGSQQTTTTSILNHTYAQNGRYIARLQVRDPNGALSNIASTTIDTADTPPTVTIDSPLQTATFAVGESISLQASASDIQDGILSDTALTWEVLLHHRAGLDGAHTHPFFGPKTGNTLAFTAPAPEDADAASNSYLEIRVTATDSAGATTTISQNLLPTHVLIHISTNPSQLSILVNGASFADQRTFVSWQGYRLNLLALPQYSAGQWLALSSWEDASSTSARTVVTSATPITFTATFARPASVSWLPIVHR